MSNEATTTLLEAIARDGYAVIPDFLTAQQLGAVHSLFDKMLGKYKGRNNFEGELTERIYTLVARDPLFADIAADPRIMALCDALFMPNYLLTASQAIVIHPGESPQPWHTDDSFYPIPRPRPMISLSTVVAVDPFTSANGGTEMVPESHLWNDEKVSGYYVGEGRETDRELAARVAEQAVPITMPAGACVIFAGTLLHRGGANTSNAPRRAFSNQYCQPWARTQENFYLGVPPEQVADMSPTLQSLLGYSIHPPFMGQITARHPRKALDPDWVPPVSKR